jgi:hypothetical protein
VPATQTWQSTKRPHRRTNAGDPALVPDQPPAVQVPARFVPGLPTRLAGRCNTGLLIETGPLAMTVIEELGVLAALLALALLVSWCLRPPGALPEPPPAARGPVAEAMGQDAPVIAPIGLHADLELVRDAVALTSVLVARQADAEPLLLDLRAYVTAVTQAEALAQASLEHELDLLRRYVSLLARVRGTADVELDIQIAPAARAARLRPLTLCTLARHLLHASPHATGAPPRWQISLDWQDPHLIVIVRLFPERALRDFSASEFLSRMAPDQARMRLDGELWTTRAWRETAGSLVCELVIDRAIRP